MILLYYSLGVTNDKLWVPIVHEYFKSIFHFLLILVLANFFDNQDLYSLKNYLIRFPFKRLDTFSSLQDENFAFIAGYTSGGFLYGITWEEHAELEKNEGKDLNLSEDKPATEEAQSHISSGTGFSGADLYELPF